MKIVEKIRSQLSECDYISFKDAQKLARSFRLVEEQLIKMRFTPIYQNNRIKGFERK